MRVLIAEDEAVLRAELSAALRDTYAVDEAPDGERADFLARTEAYDAVSSISACRTWTACRCSGHGATTACRCRSSC